MTIDFDITAVLTVHSEGVLAGPSIVSFDQAIGAARKAGLSVEGLIILDRPDVPTKQQFADANSGYRQVFTNEGDPGLARNAAVQAASGKFVAFLDGDDLWGENWLRAAHQFCLPEPEVVVAHAEFDVIFGEMRALWWQVDSRDSMFDPDLLRLSNYWDAMSFAARSIYLRHPFVGNDLNRGFGHEDWHWNCTTLAAGIDHRPVLDTVHFKRRRKGSQLSLCEAVDAIPWITPIASYAWQGHDGRTGTTA